MSSISLPNQPVSFRNPPVAEVAFTLQFGAQVIDLELLGEIARSAKQEFPRREQQPSLPPMIEEFGVPSAGPQFIFQAGPSLPRTWFVSEDGAQLVQVQADRLGYNWRRDNPEQRTYPRYHHLREEFLQHVLPAASAVAESGPSARINMIELAYVNHLVLADAQPRQPHPPLATFLRAVTSFGGEFLEEAEDSRVQARWRINGQDGTPIGRLSVSADPAYRLDQTPLYQLVLSTRLVAPHVDPSATVELFDLAHDWIVRSFKDLTTVEMHNTWGLEPETT